MKKADHHIPVAWPAPAKLNLFLHITSRREDGFHNLQTAFQFLDFSDTLKFNVRNDGLIKLACELEGVPAEDDLVVRAARLLQKHCNIRLGADIEVSKHLPMGGGLGGGSSDAATTLVALNILWDCGMDEAQLAELGLALGADIPVFIFGKAAWAEGVGEELQPIELPQPWFTVLIPPVQVSTADIFSDQQLNRACPAITIRDFLMTQETKSQQLTNVCEPVVRQHYSEVDAALKALSKFGDARMTGTGACIFAAFDSEAKAHNSFSALQSQWQGFVAQGKNTSPLYEALVV